jgi:hypothetical protein
LRTAFEQMLTAKEAPQVDTMIAAAMKAFPTVAWGITQGMYAMGAPTPRAYLAAAQDFNLRNGVAEAISCPTLYFEAEGDIFFNGQPQELFDHLTCPKTYMRFTESEGAGAHCPVGASRLAFARMYDWLDQIFGLAELPEETSYA